MPGTPVSDVIVLLPGITGSVLQKDGKDVWAISGGAAVQALTSLGKSIKRLELDGDDPDADDLGDGVTAPRVIPDAHLIPGLWKIDGYGKVSQTIRKEFDVTPGRQLLRVPVRLASRQPCARAPARPREPRLAEGLARALRQRRREARPDRPLDGRGHLPAVPRAPRGLEEHAAVHQLRHAVPWLAERTELRRQRDEEEARARHALEPDGRSALVHVRVPAAADLSLRRRRWRRAPPRHGGGRCARPRPAACEGRARLPPCDPGGRRGALRRPEYREHGHTIKPIAGVFQPTAQSARLAGGELRTLRTTAARTRAATAPSRASPRRRSS